MTDITGKYLREKSAVALGFFDGLHLGHIEVVKKTLFRKGLRSVVFTFSGKDRLPKFGDSTGRTIITYEQKKAIFEKIGVDYIYAPDFSDVKDLSAEEFVRDILKARLDAGYVVCGYDFRFGKNGAGTPAILKELCDELGIECEVVPAVLVDGEIVSSTIIRDLIGEGNIERANRLLGYEVSYTLPVISGNRIGHTLGFPTINQIIPSEMVQPKNGVYASWTEVDGKTYRSVTNIGVKPTVTDKNEVVTETHIIGYDGELYGENVKITLCRYLRGETKFGSLDELKLQLKKDVSDSVNQ